MFIVLVTTRTQRVNIFLFQISEELEIRFDKVTDAVYKLAEAAMEADDLPTVESLKQSEEGPCCELSTDGYDPKFKTDVSFEMFIMM